MYALQTLDHILQPNSELESSVGRVIGSNHDDDDADDDDDDASAVAADDDDKYGAKLRSMAARATALKHLFVSTGGFTFLLEVVMAEESGVEQPAIEKSLIRRATLCTALHIMHFLLLGSLM